MNYYGVKKSHADVREQSLSSICSPMTLLSQLCPLFTIVKLHDMLFPPWAQYCWTVQEKTMWYITTCQRLPITQSWYSKRRSFTFYPDDHDTGTQLSLQRTRHVNTISLAGLSDKVWPIGQLLVNKISVFYHSSLSQTSNLLFMCW